MKFYKSLSLQAHILILFIFLLLVVQLVSFASSYYSNKQLENYQLSNRLHHARKVFDTQFGSRRYYLSAFAETVAKDHGLKSVFLEDNKSFLVALNNHRKRIQADIALAIDSNDRMFALLETVKDTNGIKKVKIGAAQGELFPYNKQQLQMQTSPLVSLNQQLYQLSVAPIKSGARTIGYIGLGYIVDHALADQFALLTGVNIAFLKKVTGKWQLMASSNGETLFDYSEAAIAGLIKQQNESYIGNIQSLGEVNGEGWFVLMFQSKADVLHSISSDWQQLLLLLAVTLILSLLTAVFFARSITKPVNLLIKKVKSITHGNYEGEIAVDGSKEFEALSGEFNHMKKAIVYREELISHQAYHDALTQLPNKNYLVNDLLQQKEQGDNFILLQLGILRAEDIYDTLGHKVGDDILVKFAKRLQASNLGFRCYYLGGVQFVLLLDYQDIKAFIHKLLAELALSYQYENLNLHLQYAMGVVIAAQQSSGDISQLIQKSSVALQYAKNQKKLYQIYQSEFNSQALERLYLTSALKAAIEQNQLVLYYQPKLSLANMQVDHVEALVRWQHPDKGLIPPDSFIYIAEKTGQMGALTRWVSQAAIEQYLRWQQAGINMQIAINISAANLADKSYSDFLIALKRQHRLADNAISLEVTEDVVVSDPQKAIEVLSYLKSFGFNLSIDDYGTGYSSLAQLKCLPVQELKIDRSFVQHLQSSEEDQFIVTSTLELAHHLALSVVAEGVEDEATLLWLKQKGCELAQGYFISKPLPAEAFENWLYESPYYIERVEV
jgi:diguanylate cyclase (GGDEF)-like protein